MGKVKIILRKKNELANEKTHIFPVNISGFFPWNCSTFRLGSLFQNCYNYVINFILVFNLFLDLINFVQYKK